MPTFVDQPASVNCCRKLKFARAEEDDEVEDIDRALALA